MPLDRLIGTDSTNPVLPAIVRILYDHKLALHNWTQANNANLLKALALANAGGHANIVFIGDSLTAAVSPLVTFRDSFVYQLVDALEANGMVIAGAGPVYANANDATPDSRWAFSAGWSVNVNWLGRFTTTSGANATFTSVRRGSNVDIHYVDAGGPFTYSIDGAAAVAVVPTGGGTTVVLSIPGLADTPHKVTITTTTAGLTFLLGIAVREAVGLSIVNAGLAGSATAAWLPAAGATNDDAITALQPLAVFVMLGANDELGAVPPATYQANLTAIVNWVKALASNPSVWLAVEPPRDPATYPLKAAFDLATYAAAAAADLTVIDWQKFFVNWATVNAAPDFAFDIAHLTRPGQTVIAQHYAMLLGGGTQRRASSGLLIERGTARTLSLADWGDPDQAPNVLYCDNAASCALTVAPFASVPAPLRSRIVIIGANPAGQTTLVAGAGVFILPPTGQALNNKALFSEVTLTCIAPDVWIAGGDLTGA